MIKNRIYILSLSTGLFLLLWSGLAEIGMAQEIQDTLVTIHSDTSQVKQKLKQQNRQAPQHYNFDRSTHKYLTPENKRFNVPSPRKYYHPPITAQKSLDAAMEVLRRELENSITNSRFYQILTKIAPFINNVFVFGYYDQTAPVVSPFNPYLYPQTKQGQAWRDYMEKRHYSKSDKSNQK